MVGDILLIGAMDTKGEEYAFVKALIEKCGHRVLTVDFGVMQTSNLVEIDWSAEQVAQLGGSTLQELRKIGDRGHAMEVMSKGAERLTRKLFDEGKFQGVLGMGGTGGTSVISRAMQALPIGVPKVLVSTAASGDTRAVVGIKDITLIPSVVDVAGINQVSRRILESAVGAICGMVSMVSMVGTERVEGGEEKPVIAITMFGNTTECVDRCRNLLTAKGFECLVFHCTGTGGRTMEALVYEGIISAVLDITTTEWADELCGGVFSAGQARLEAPGRIGIPHLVVPGCVDMVNFGPKETIPSRYRDRKIYAWNPLVTLMRTNVEENDQLGRIFADKLNQSTGQVRVLWPKAGVSILDSEGNEFWWPEADEAMLQSLKSNLRPEVPFEEMNCNINDPPFADRAVDILLGMLS